LQSLQKGIKFIKLETSTKQIETNIPFIIYNTVLSKGNDFFLILIFLKYLFTHIKNQKKEALWITAKNLL